MFSSVPCDATSGLLRLSQVVPQQLEWLWTSHIPLGYLTLFQGDPGVGKSLLALDLCSRVTTGRPFPDGSASADPADVLIWNTEDESKAAARERLAAAGADLHRVHVPDDDVAAESLRLPSGIATLDAHLIACRARLVVLDPIVAFLDRKINTHDDKSLRQALTPLAQTARRHRCAMILILHLNKQPGSHAIYRGGGSIAFQAAVRSSWHVARHPWRPDQGVIAHVKSNYGPLQPTRAFAKEQANADSSPHTPCAPSGTRSVPPTLTTPHAAPTVRWLETCELAADQLAGGAGRSYRPRDRARELMEDFLSDEPRTSAEVRRFCERHGLAERTVRRAKRELQLQRVAVNHAGRKSLYLLLPGQSLPDDIPTSSIECNPEEILRQMPISHSGK
jgi:hypothetical protein